MHKSNGKKVTLVKYVCTCFSKNRKLEKITEIKEEAIHWIAGLGTHTDKRNLGDQ